MPLDEIPAPPIISREREVEKERPREREAERERPRERERAPRPREREREREKSVSPIPEGGAGDCLSIEETNKLRLKLGLKPLEVGSTETKKPDDSESKEDSAEPNLKKIKDDWGEFYHKPAGTFNEKNQLEKMRDKLKEKREKRKIDSKLSRVKTLGDSDSGDDLSSWVNKSRKLEELKKEAQRKAKMLEEMDEEISHGDISERDFASIKKKSYKDRDLRGLKVEHDLSSFSEDRVVILTLKDQDVLNDEGDTLVNVNMIDDERYKKNVENKKQNPNTYGYNVYEDEMDEFGNPLNRAILKKYDEEIDGSQKTSFVLGHTREIQEEEKRRAAEIKAKLQHKTLESLNTEPLKIASDYLTESELTKFKKPKKKIKKIRQKLRADDLLDMVGEVDSQVNLGSRNRNKLLDTDDTPAYKEDLSRVKLDEEEDDLEQVLSKARRLKQKESIIRKEIPMQNIVVKTEIKEESDSDEESKQKLKDSGFITFNQTAEFCRTLGDIPTYGMAGNREDNEAEIMDFDNLEEDLNDNGVDGEHGQWNAVDPDEQQDHEMDGSDVEEVAILDEEPDVASGVAAALQLAMSKGYLEKEDSNRPSNTRFAHLQAKHYSIEDKAHEGDDKYSRRDRYSGPLMDFKEKDSFKPNVKLEYIDDNGHILNAKEAFRYLSHKFHGKGPGKNKVEKRLKKSEQEGVSFHYLLIIYIEI